jgi:quinol monooxygenase YgiN
MYLRLVQFNLGEGARDTAESIANRIVPLIRQQPGCQRAEFFGEAQSGDYGLVVLWASQHEANAAAGVVSPILGQLLQQARAVGDHRRLFEVYEPQE